ncbi:MAG: sodium/glucose cotransporter 2, partial [Pseudomonadota bacterium]
VPPIAAVFLLGVMSPRGTAQAAFATLMSGFTLGVGLFALSQLGLWELHFSINVGLMFGVSAVVYLFVSWRGEAPAPAEVRDLVYRPGLAAPDTPVRWYADYRFHAAVLALGMAWVLVVFW